MANLPQPFPSQVPTETFTFTDLFTGRGIQTLFGGGLRANAAYIWNTNAFWSEKLLTGSASVSETDFTLKTDIDFDVRFEEYRVVDGVAIINIPSELVNTSGTGGREWYFTVTVYHYDGTTETQLAQTQGPTNAHDAGGGTGAADQINSIDLDIPRQVFKPNETLRVTIQLFAKVATGGQTCTIALWHDPKDRNVDPDGVYGGDPPSTTVLQMTLPFFRETL